MGLFFIQSLSDGSYYVCTNVRFDDDDVIIGHLFSNHLSKAFLFTSKADAEGHATEIGLYSEIPGGIKIIEL